MPGLFFFVMTIKSNWTDRSLIFLLYFVCRSVRRNTAFVSTGDVFLRGPAVYTVLAISFSNMSNPVSLQTVVAVHRLISIFFFSFESDFIWGIPNHGLLNG